MKKSGQSLRDLWDIIKLINTFNMNVSGEEGRDKYYLKE